MGLFTQMNSHAIVPLVQFSLNAAIRTLVHTKQEN